MNQKYWDVNKKFNDDLYEKIKDNVGELTAKVLASRKDINIDNVDDFLFSDVQRLHDPFLFEDMEKAVKKIVKAGESNKKILIYSDYDVDGVTGCSILYNFLNSLKYDINYYIPDRIEEGYGLSEKSVSNVLDLNPDLIITVDCGITAKKHVQKLRENNIEVIVTDHHESSKEKLPECFAIIAVSKPNCKYPFSHLCGAGIAFKLVTAMCLHLKLGKIYLDYLDLAALATVADIVKLKGENRIIVKLGMKRIENTENIGLKELLKVSKLEGKRIKSYHLGFLIGPRLNAAGRMGAADRGVKLLTLKDQDKCIQIAREIDRENSKRRMMQKSIMQQADMLVKKQNDLEKDRVLVVANKGWHHGIIGIVSSKITDKYSLPSILLSIDEDIAKGSGRSVENFNLYKALLSVENLLDRYGGHEAAAGMSLKSDNVDDFRKFINKYAEDETDLADIIPRLRVDVPVSLDDVTLENIEDMQQLQPYGEGNREPVFLCKNLNVVYCKLVGKNKEHLSIRFKKNNRYVGAIGFNMATYYDYLEKGAKVHAVFSLSINEWKGRKNPSLKIKDIQFTDKETINRNFYNHLVKNVEFERFKGYNTIKELKNKIKYSYLTVANKKPKNEMVSELVNDITNVDRKIVAAIYRYVKYRKPVLKNCQCTDISNDLMRMSGVYINPIKMLLCLKILYDLDIITANRINDRIKLELNENLSGKVDMDGSQIYKKTVSIFKKVI